MEVLYTEENFYAAKLSMYQPARPLRERFLVVEPNLVATSSRRVCESRPPLKTAARDRNSSKPSPMSSGSSDKSLTFLEVNVLEGLPPSWTHCRETQFDVPPPLAPGGRTSSRGCTPSRGRTL
ncbi:hypothetical protein Dimus_024679 [Dionaea muscipula]